MSKKLNEAREIGMWHLYATTRDTSRESGTPFTISYEEFAKLSQKRCTFCNGTGTRQITTKFKVCPLEPIKPSDGLTPKNTIPVCYYCSRIRKRLEWSSLKRTAKICKKLEKLIRG